jgi:hypothetical protein
MTMALCSSLLWFVDWKEETFTICRTGKSTGKYHQDIRNVMMLSNITEIKFDHNAVYKLFSLLG